MYLFFIINELKKNNIGMIFFFFVFYREVAYCLYWGWIIRVFVLRRFCIIFNKGKETF